MLFCSFISTVDLPKIYLFEAKKAKNAPKNTMKPWFLVSNYRKP